MEKLNREQLKAVQHQDGPLLIVAGAGTGKTTVITQRIAYLIEQGRAKPEEILALTFTEKAAAEMSDRVDRLLPIGYLDLWISTFHSFCERILGEHGLDVGLPGNFKLLNEFEQHNLIRKNLAKFNLDYYRPLGNPTKFIGALVSHFSRLKDEDISAADYLHYAEELKENADNMLAGSKKKIPNSKFQIPNLTNKEGAGNREILAQEAARVNEVANAYHVYQQLLLDNCSFDFGDLINYSLKLFRERPLVLEKYRRQFKYILLDEFQDTNWAQYELIKLLAAPINNLAVVGDDDQAIYKFRGASVSNILQFRKDYPAAAQIFLTKNYRNRQNILNLSYKFIKQNDPNRLEYQLNKNQVKKVSSENLSKKLVAQVKGEGIIKVIKGEDLTGEINQTVLAIADIKAENREVSWNDFVILVRANEAAKDFCAALEVAGLPYIFLSSRGLYAKPIIMDVIAYLKLLDDYHESISLFRILNLPIFNFSHQELMNLNYVARKKAWSLFTVLKDTNGKLGREMQGRADKILSLIEKHTALARQKSVQEVIIAFLNDSGYLKDIAGREEKESREVIGYLNQFMKRVRVFEASSDDKSIKAFMAELNAEIEAGEEGALPFDLEAGPEAIKIMTIHAAKGLEFNYVFIANLVDKRFPTIERREPIAIPDALVKEILPEGDIHLEEERRLFYVAMTRARKHLYFSWAPDYGGVRLKKPSRFLGEIGLVKGGQKDNGQTRKKEDSQFTTNSRAIRAGKEDYKLPFYLSYSQLSLFEDCPYKYRFSYILKVPTRGKHFFSFGETMHLTLEEVFRLVREKLGLDQDSLFRAAAEPIKKKRKAKISLEEVIGFYEKNWIDDWYESAAQKDEYKKLGRKVLKEFLELNENNWPETILLEKNFNFKIDAGGQSYSIRGRIDRVDKVGDKVKIIDYKTGRPKKKLETSDKEQLLIYQLALEDIFKYEVGSLAFYYLEDNSEIEFLGGLKELSELKEKIIRTIENINQGEFPPKPGPLCQYCDYKEICEFKKSK